MDKNAPGSGPGNPVFRRRDTVFLLVRMDHQSDGRPSQLHGPGSGSYGRQDVPVHGDLEPGLDHSDRAAERRVVCAGVFGENVVRENHLTAGHHLHHDRALGIVGNDRFVSVTVL